MNSDFREVGCQMLDTLHNIFPLFCLGDSGLFDIVIVPAFESGESGIIWCGEAVVYAIEPTATIIKESGLFTDWDACKQTIFYTKFEVKKPTIYIFEQLERIFSLNCFEALKIKIKIFPQ